MLKLLPALLAHASLKVRIAAASLLHALTLTCDDRAMLLLAPATLSMVPKALEEAHRMPEEAPAASSLS